MFARHTQRTRTNASVFPARSRLQEVCSQIWATLYDYPSLRTTEGLLSYVKESVRLAWGLINQVRGLSVGG